MKAEYVNDPVKGPGYALLLLVGDDVPDAPATARCIIKRSSDGKTLGRGGWDRAECDLPCRGIQLADEGIALSVGPEVVDNLDALEGYRLVLRCADGRQAVSSLHVAGIVYSPQTGVRGVAEAPYQPEATTPQAPPQPELDESVAEPETASSQPGDISDHQEISDDDIITLDNAVPREEPAAPPYADIPPLPPRPAGGKSRTPLAAGLILLLAVCAGAAVLKMRPDATKNDVPPARPPLADGAVPEAAPPAAAPPTGGEQSPPAAPPSDKPVDAGRAGETSSLNRARGHLAGTADPEASLALYRQLRTEENGADAAFLLVEDAAQKGLPEAMLLVAGWYDPLVVGDKGSIKTDAEEAFNWYTKAAQAGVAEAEARLAALKARVAAEAAAGDREAERLLKRFPR
ncbi:MAG: hypothetical protein LBR82_08595 [Desulfovibrio sp.]|jgi:hypothetical protein|nr:hypothetical protein [Desulfovibrio sp.]